MTGNTEDSINTSTQQKPLADQQMPSFGDNIYLQHKISGLYGTQ